MLFPFPSDGLDGSASALVEVPAPTLPTADFDFVADEMVVAFSDASLAPGSEIVSWQWDFGDGTYSIIPDPTHAYVEEGTYAVALTIRTALGLSAIVTQDVTVPSSITSLSAAIAALAGKTLRLAPGTYELDASVTDTTTRIVLQHGVVITVPISRTLGSSIDFSSGGQIQPAAGITVTLTGRLTLPANHHAFDLSKGGTVRLSPFQQNRLTPENFGAQNQDATFNVASVSTGSDTFTKTAHGLSTGQLIGFTTTGTLPSGADIATPFYAIVPTVDTFKIAATLADALAGNAIDLGGSPSGTHTVLVYEDVAVRAWIAACSWSGTSAHGGIEPVVVAGLGYLVGGLLDPISVKWDSVEHHKEWVCLQWTAQNLKIRGPGARMSSFHFRPLNKGGSADDRYQLFRWEITDDESSLVQVGASGFNMRAGNSHDVVKEAMYCHDIRNSKFSDLEVNNWSDTSRRSLWLRLAGRDANVFREIKTNCDIPYVFDFNVRESLSLDANGMPLWDLDGNDDPIYLRDRKDHDHNSFICCDFGTVDTSGDPNPWRASGWNRAGVVGFNYSQKVEGDCVGGILVSRDRLDGAAQDLGARSGNSFTVVGHGRTVADEVRLTTTGTAPGGLTAKSWYYLIPTDPDTLQLASSAANALAGVPVTISSDGTGTHTISGTAFGGALVPARRQSKQWSLCDNRIEGLANAHAGVFAIDIERHPNSPLYELTLQNLEIASQGNARRSIQTGSSSYTSNKCSGIRAEGVMRVEVGAGVRFGGLGEPLRVSDYCQVVFARDQRGRIAAAMVPQDRGIIMPESDYHWDFLNDWDLLDPADAIVKPQHYYLMQTTAEAGDVLDQQTAGTDYPLIASANAANYLELVDEFGGAWILFDETANQKLNLNTTAAEFDPTTADVIWGGLVYATDGWTPGGTQRDIFNLGGGNVGPILRWTSGAGTLYLRVNSTDGTASANNYNDGVPFWAVLSYDRTNTVVECLLRKITGEEETITHTWSATSENNAGKCVGAFDASRRSWSGGIRYLFIGNGSAARQDKSKLLDALRSYAA